MDGLREGDRLNKIFDVIPDNYFNLLASNSNYRTNSFLLQFIYQQYDNEISYRIKRTVLRDELAYFIWERILQVIISENLQVKKWDGSRRNLKIQLLKNMW